MTRDIPEAADETTETTEAAGESRTQGQEPPGINGTPWERRTSTRPSWAGRVLTVEGLAERAGLSETQVRSYWQALGLPITEEQEQMFTEDDAVALEEIYSVAESERFDDRSLTTLIRSMGHTTERLVLWQVEALVEHMSTRFDLDDTSARLLVLDRLPDLAPVLETQLRHAWRRQLAAVAARFAVEFSQARSSDVADAQALPLPRAVGFADIVSFTKRTAAWARATSRSSCSSSRPGPRHHHGRGRAGRQDHRGCGPLRGRRRRHGRQGGPRPGGGG
ncbi:hypothetical protein NKG05_23970 [Oerskovia sp. M15]